MSFFFSITDAEKAELWSILALRHTHGIGPRRARRLMEHYGSAFAAVEDGRASPRNWPERGLVSEDIARAFAIEAWRNGARAEWDAIRRSGCAFLVWTEPRYPPLLHEIPDAPLLLYYQGDISLLRGPTVAIVGARDCTREGIAVAAFFARDLSRSGVTIISGLARGIDRAAHLGGLDGPGGTIAVLGTGIDVQYPPCNTDLFARIAEQALLISEFAPGTVPNSRNFPVRNRLISALSQGVLVVEAAARSGSLITAHLALEQNKDVFAVPGHTMAAVSEGCRELIRRGARAVFCADDILADLAPLLTLEARKALEGRRDSDGSHTAPTARSRKQALDTQLLADAQAVLPEGDLPWLAPSRKLSSEAGSHSPRSHREPGCSTDIAPESHRKKISRAAQDAERGATEARTRKLPDGLEPDSRRVLDALGRDKRHIDDICRSLGMDVAKLSSILTLLEVRGLVRRDPGMLYFMPESEHYG